MSERRSFPQPPHRANALVLSAHPADGSLCAALARAWSDGAAEAGLPVRQIEVAGLNFDVSLHGGYHAEQALEPDLVMVRDALAEAAHVVVVSPLWWSSVPARLKGLFDRVLLPGWAFAYVNHRPVPGLSGRSGRLIMTMDAPVWYDSVFNRGAARRQVAHGTLRFCGLSPVDVRAFGSVGTSTPAARAAMLERCVRDGRDDAQAVRTRLERRPTAIDASATA